MKAFELDFLGANRLSSFPIFKWSAIGRRQSMTLTFQGVIDFWLSHVTLVSLSVNEHHASRHTSKQT